MPTLNMKGPYPLTNKSVDAHIEPSIIGNYALGYKNTKGKFIVRYVGRSTDLNQRIKDHLGEYFDCNRFKCSEAKNESDAYEKECQNYHDFGGEQGNLYNKIHPARPSGLAGKLSSCPVCGQ